MCGIAGIISTDLSVIHQARLQKMSDVLAHRGPDDEGHWINSDNSTGFAHRRLAIIDLSPLGAQPMHYLERYTIVYNGEIYNYIELRKELKKGGYHFNSNSDTEVILAAYDCYKEKCVQYFDGMFAFAIWDEKQRTLFAARDRMGEKPFYYYAEKTLFVFGSEMKALWAAGVRREVEDKMLLNYITLGYVQNPADKAQTFFRNIYSLAPAHYMTVHQPTMRITIENYWDVDKQAEIRISEEAAIEKLDRLFSASISRRLRSDVPIGASLSGGLDSSSIVCYLSRQLRNAATPYKTFSAVFPGFEQDESKYVDQIANNFHVESYSTVPSAIELIDDFEKLCWHQEEPFPSSSIYAQYKVFELAKKHNVKVLLDGQGADEILAGYHKYVHWYLQEMLSRYKFSGTKTEKLLLQKNKVDFRWSMKNVVAAFLPSHASIALEKKEYLRIIQHGEVSKSLLGNLKGREWEGIHKPVVTKLNDILYFSTMQHGLQELLRYSDRSSMAHGREVRLPFLNAELVQFVFSLPSAFKIKNGFTKSILRKLMDDKLPQNIVWRTDKIGFEPPQKAWMQDAKVAGAIQAAKGLLVEKGILAEGVLSQKIKPHDAHAAESRDWRYWAASFLYR